MVVIPHLAMTILKTQANLLLYLRLRLFLHEVVIRRSCDETQVDLHLHTDRWVLQLVQL